LEKEVFELYEIIQKNEEEV
jgi:hypothetical protein